MVDLGAAPGGWSQVAKNLSGRKAERPKSPRNAGASECDVDIPTARRDVGKIIALDILPIEAIEGVHTIQGDFLSPSIRDQVKELVGDGGVDTVLSDMMGSMTGVRDRDVQMSLDLCMAAWDFGRGVLKVALEEKEGAGNEGVEEGVEDAVGKDEKKRGRTLYPGGNMVYVFLPLHCNPLKYLLMTTRSECKTWLTLPASNSSLIPI